MASRGSDPWLGKSLANRYLIESHLGDGGMGYVYKARSAEGPVALKVIHPHLSNNPSIIQRFRREATVASRVESPYTVKILDFDYTEDGVLYMAMELLRGKTLGDLLHRGGPMPPARVAKLGAQLSRGLATAHKEGIIHRDLKPSNVMVLSEDRLKILDFGIARVLQADESETNYAERETRWQALTQAGALIGTLEYMSPEQIAHEPLDHRSDLYSMGVLLYEMLAGRPPFECATPRAALRAHLYTEPPPIPDAPAPLFELVLELLAKSPDQRIQDGLLVAKRLDTMQESDPDELPSSSANQTMVPEAEPRSSNLRASRTMVPEVFDEPFSSNLRASKTMVPEVFDEPFSSNLRASRTMVPENLDNLDNEVPTFETSPAPKPSTFEGSDFEASAFDTSPFEPPASQVPTFDEFDDAPSEVNEPDDGLSGPEALEAEVPTFEASPPPDLQSPPTPLDARPALEPLAPPPLSLQTSRTLIPDDLHELDALMDAHQHLSEETASAPQATGWEPPALPLVGEEPLGLLPPPAPVYSKDQPPEPTPELIPEPPPVELSVDTTPSTEAGTSELPHKADPTFEIPALVQPDSVDLPTEARRSPQPPRARSTIDPAELYPVELPEEEPSTFELPEIEIPTNAPDAERFSGFLSPEPTPVSSPRLPAKTFELPAAPPAAEPSSLEPPAVEPPSVEPPTVKTAPIAGNILNAEPTFSLLPLDLPDVEVPDDISGAGPEGVQAASPPAPLSPLDAPEPLSFFDDAPTVRIGAQPQTAAPPALDKAPLTSKLPTPPPIEPTVATPPPAVQPPVLSQLPDRSPEATWGKQLPPTDKELPSTALPPLPDQSPEATQGQRPEANKQLSELSAARTFEFPDVGLPPNSTPPAEPPPAPDAGSSALEEVEPAAPKPRSKALKWLIAGGVFLLGICLGGVGLFAAITYALRGGLLSL